MKSTLLPPAPLTEDDTALTVFVHVDGLLFVCTPTQAVGAFTSLEGEGSEVTDAAEDHRIGMHGYPHSSLHRTLASRGWAL